MTTRSLGSGTRHEIFIQAILDTPRRSVPAVCLFELLLAWNGCIGRRYGAMTGMDGCDIRVKTRYHFSDSNSQAMS